MGRLFLLAFLTLLLFSFFQLHCFLLFCLFRSHVGAAILGLIGGEGVPGFEKWKERNANKS